MPNEDLPARGEPAKKQRAAPNPSNRKEAAHGTLSRYTGKYRCRCDLCSTAMREYRAKKRDEQRAQEGKPVLPKRPPGVVWVDATDYTAVVRCERCDKNWGPWVLDPQGATEFAQDHRGVFHAYESGFDWSKWSRERAMKNPGGRPPLEDKPLCTYQDCSEDAHAKGLCMKHYQRALRGGLYE